MNSLPVASLKRRCDPTSLSFANTSELEPATEPLGQNRALDALRFGARIRGHGYNVFACGPTGTGRLALVQNELAIEGATRPVPQDWCYVHNFRQAHRPLAIPLPAGEGAHLVEDMARLLDDLQTALPAAFGRDENRSRQEEIEEQFQERQQQALNALRQQAEQQGVLLVETPSSFAFAPRGEGGEPMPPVKFRQLPEVEQERIKQVIENLQEEMQRTVRQFPIWFKEMRERLRALNREIAEYVVSHLLDDLLARYKAYSRITDYLAEVKADILETAPVFMPPPPQAPALLDPAERQAVLQRYAVNLLVDNRDLKSAPVVLLDLPSIGNLLGRIEHRASMGTLTTDLTLIKSGALHRANGGFLIVDARQILLQPFAWEALKRALRARDIRLDAMEMQFSVLTTETIEPSPIPLDVKIVLIGERWLLYTLEAHDPEFRELFKVVADFDDEIPRTAAHELQYARTFARLAREAGGRALDRGAVAVLIEHCSRLAEDAERLSTHLHGMDDLIHEADYLATTAGHTVIEATDIKAAIEQQRHRLDRLREHMLDSIRRGVKIIATDGAAVGQVNGLSVISMDSYSFGVPSRITATTRLGDGRVIDIERETELGGAIHSKGVLILSHYLATRYASGVPLSMVASLVFEQSYGMVDGDSASLAELCALLSSLSGTPILQRFAVTGSVNQLGEVQAIGGVNEKIEGFFDVCQARGAISGQGVLIPAANREHLMLRDDVIEAAARDEFRIYAVTTVDEAIELLTGLNAGVRDAAGEYPTNTVNRLVEERLLMFSRLRREFGRASEASKDHA